MMQFCMSHWNALKAAILERGLGEYIATSSEEMIKRLEDSPDTDGVTLGNFELLMGAHNAILSNLSGVNPRVLFVEGCPICFANEAHKDHCEDKNCTYTFDNWITYAADDQLDVFNGLSNK